jgi:membrane fusion protein (multidrug efflux system)
VEGAKLDLDNTTVTAPIAGRAGRSMVTEGALVSAASGTLLTIIEQLDPIHVNFSASSGDVLRAQRDIAAGRLKVPELKRVEVSLLLEDGSAYPQKGHLNFMDLAVDVQTGTTALRAEFPNPRRILLPGQFVRARVDAGVRPDAVVIPQRAVTVTPKGGTVMVVGADDVAATRPIELGSLQGSDWIVLDGLKAGERVIVDGLQKVRPGQPVTVTPADAAKTDAGRR